MFGNKKNYVNKGIVGNKWANVNKSKFGNKKRM